MSRKFGLPGRVFLVGPVSASLESITSQAMDILRQAEVVLHDEGVPWDSLQEVPKSSLVLNVSGAGTEQVIERMIAAADEGKVVVRLTVEGPLAPGSTENEAEALREAGIDFQILPGLTKAVAAA
jgi:siroheme synthase